MWILVTYLIFFISAHITGKLLGSAALQVMLLLPLVLVLLPVVLLLLLLLLML